MNVAKKRAIKTMDKTAQTIAQSSLSAATSNYAFANAVTHWQKKHGRHNLPWTINATPYTIWLSEIMLQQTQAATVIPYYHYFVRRFPTVQVLARARNDTVMAAWSGLGYYARARNLHAAAKVIAQQGFPQTAEEWQQLAGVGKSTAAAIAVFANGQRAAILDGNVKRVLARAFAIDSPVESVNTEKILWVLADSLLPPIKNIKSYTQGMMDLGATVCTRTKPQCDSCPLRSMCVAKQKDLTESLPRRRVKKTKPQKTVYMALLIYENCVFLQKRPPSGIWGGLRSLPQTSTAKELYQIGKQFGGDEALQHTGEFHHEFTHYKLHAKVHVFFCDSMNGDKTNWIRWRNLNKTALPAPVRKYINDALAMM